MKKNKVLLVLAVPAAACMLTAGALTGCGEHEHSYTKWAHDDTRHWLVCPDDDAKDESSVKDHEYGFDGKCECGFEKPHEHAYTKWAHNDTEHWKVCPADNKEEPGSRKGHTYTDSECECGRQVGAIEGQIKLYRLGKEVTDLTGVTVKLGDSAITLDKDGNLSVENLEVGKTYNLTVSKDGYDTYTQTIEVEKGVTLKVGDKGVVTLQYGVFSNQNLTFLDYSTANDGYVTFTGKGKTEDKLLSAEKFFNVDVTAKFEITDEYTKSGNSNLYSVGLKFDDGKELRIDARFKNDGCDIFHPNWRTVYKADEYADGHIFYNWSSVDAFTNS
ncbi:MAG: carboxypeptidase-like regulatory domain-containing protein, partial [Ruminococcus flavefaciens]|nr:carboxypeptidase-like regulatory domain-containing protein [Ruminococcus flavefaciens]